MSKQEKIPYFTRMLTVGVLMVVGGAVAYDIYDAATICKALMIPGAFISLAGFIGRVVTILDS